MAASPQQTPLSRVLALMASGSAAAEWEESVREAQRAGALAEADAAALRLVRDGLRDASRRQGLLRLLYETSTDLIAIRDVEAVLKAIVRRTRSLIGTDLAYLSLNDYGRSESYVRVTDGATTAAFRSIRIPLGGGVLGAVATGTAPSQSADYPLDTTKSHFPTSDAAVIGEGVKAIMGVPLWASGKVIGALMVADRHAHAFGSDDIDLMESIGAHAAVALENARLFTEMADALDRLHESRRQNDEHVRTLETLTALDRRLMETLASDAILPGLQELISQALGAAAWILAPGRVAVGPDRGPGWGQDPAIQAAAESSRAANAPQSVTLSGGRFLVMAADAGGQHLADILAADPAADPAAVTAVLERSALVLSAAMLFERTLHDAQYRLQRDLIDELLSPRSEITDALKERAQRFGVAEGTRLAVHAVGVDADSRRHAMEVLRHAAQGRQLVAVHESFVCIVAAAPADGAAGLLGQQAADRLAAEGIRATIGSSRVVNGLGQLPRAFREARTAHNALLALGREGGAADLPGLGTAGMLVGATDSAFAEELLAVHLGALLDYDRQRGTELAKTAWCYFESGSSHTAAAARLRIHPNTMRQRLDRIDDVLSPAWRQGGRALDTHVALCVWRLKAAGVLDDTTAANPM